MAQKPKHRTSRLHSYCTAMVLNNLAEPQWVPVMCNNSLAQVVFCQIEKDTRFQPLPQSHKMFQGSNLSCNKNTLLLNELCVSFEWCTVLTASKLSLQLKQFHDATGLQTVFYAVSEPFPPYFLKNHSCIVTFSKCSRTFRLQEDLVMADSVEAFYVHTTNVKRHTRPGNVYQCSGGEFISAIFVCDGKKQCSSEDQEEEGIGCTTEMWASKFKHDIKLSVRKGLSASCLGNCVKRHLQLSNHTKTGGQASFQRVYTPGRLNVSVSFGNMSQSVEDETTNDRPVNNCQRQGQLSCGYGSHVCFNISQICTFKVDFSHQLMICRTGKHLQNCSSFSCNIMFKCPNFYCVQFSYICNGKWDCPGGVDESALSGCAMQRKCPNLFKCAHNYRCTHLEDVCDGHTDCPHGDDELFCSLKMAKCPLQCKCLLFSISCINFALLHREHFSYHNIWFRKTLFGSSRNFIDFFSNAVLLTVVDSGLVHVCQSGLKMSNLIMLNVSMNSVATLETGCFQSSIQLQILDLSRNMIQTVQQNAFTNISELMLLNLTGNAATVLSNMAFSGLQRIRLLSLDFQSTTFIAKNTFEKTSVDVLQTDSYHLCCLMDVNCTSPFPWYISCASLLPNKAMRVTWYLMSAIISSGTLASIIHEISHQKGLDKIEANGITIISINIAGYVYILPLSILWVADLHYSYNIVLKETEWRSSAPCFTAFGATLKFSFISPFLLSFLSFSRWMIVVHPIDTDFKRANFVLKCISALFVLSTVVASVLTLSYFLHEHLIPVVLCSPFVDPTDSSTPIVVFTGTVAVTQTVCTAFIILVYSFMVRDFKTSQASVQKVSKRKSNAALYAQIIVSVFSNLLCSIPCGVIFLTCLVLMKYPVNIPVWTTILVIPLNSLVHPFLHLVAASRKFLSSHKGGPGVSDLQQKVERKWL